MELQIPQYTSMRWQVSDWGGPFRLFETKEQAERFVADNKEFWIDYIPKKFKKITIEEAPF